jgi:hypothetical protein
MSKKIRCNTTNMKPLLDQLYVLILKLNGKKVPKVKRTQEKLLKLISKEPYFFLLLMTLNTKIYQNSSISHSKAIESSLQLVSPIHGVCYLILETSFTLLLKMDQELIFIPSELSWLVILTSRQSFGQPKKEFRFMKTTSIELFKF